MRNKRHWVHTLTLRNLQVSHLPTCVIALDALLLLRIPLSFEKDVVVLRIVEMTQGSKTITLQTSIRTPMSLVSSLREKESNENILLQRVDCGTTKGFSLDVTSVYCGEGER